jgi:hypothetical protein
VIDDDTPEGYEDLQEMATSLRRPLKSLYALSSGNDPFMAARPSRLAAALWIAELYARLGFAPGTHVRRIHYALVSQPTPVLMVNGEPYENTLNCSSDLGEAVRDARYLDLIPANAIIDRRNPEPAIYFADEDESPAEIDTSAGHAGAVIGLSYHGADLEPPSLSVTIPKISQRYHLETWCEKSTMNDIIMPLGSEYGMNIVTGVGDMSTTQCEDLVNRVEASDRPVRILYVSDFDPAGLSMPLSVARKVEFLARKAALDSDIQLRNVVLTHDQCVEYQLPRTPLKESLEGRGTKFEERFGEGATELDALEAIHPGVLRGILVTEIERYFDADLADSIEEVVNEVEDDLDEIKSRILDHHADEIEALAKEREALNAEGTKEIEKVRQLMAAKEQAYHERAHQLLAAIAEELEAEAPDVDGYDWPEAAEGDEDPDPLYDSTRSYLDQIDRYRQHQGKSAEVGLRRDREFPLACQKCGNTFTSSKPAAKFCSQKCRMAAWHKLNPKPSARARAQPKAGS